MATHGSTVCHANTRQMHPAHDRVMVSQVMKAVRKFRSEKGIDHKAPLLEWLGGDDSNKPFDNDGTRRARAAERWLQGAGTVFC